MAPALDARDRRALRLGGLLVGLALLVRLAALPYLGRLGAAVAARDEQRALLARERVLLREAALLPAEFRRASARFLAQAPRLVPGATPAEAQARLAGRVDALAGGFGCSLSRLEALPTAPTPDGLVALPLRIAGEGELRCLLRLIAALEEGPLLVQLEGLSLEARARRADAPREQPDAGRLDFAFTLRALMLDEGTLLREGR